MRNHNFLFTDGFFSGAFGNEYQSYIENHDAALLTKLIAWESRTPNNEISEEQNFIRTFFQDTWGYLSNGEVKASEGYQLYPQYPIKRSGQSGGTGRADLAIGWFDKPGSASTVQVVCEFKDITSGLDIPQKRKGNNRSPVKQCADYLKEARLQLYGNEPIQPQWCIVSDMSEFRLYFWSRMPAQYQSFVLCELIENSEYARFQRFIFWKIFQPEMLLTDGGPSRLETLFREQGKKEKILEDSFYIEYQAFREKLYIALVKHNPNFNGTKGDLVRISQKIVDRLIFILYCEDMGKSLDFPQNLLRDLLLKLAEPDFYQADDTTAWDRLQQLFFSMATGQSFASRKINKFNGGLFSKDDQIDNLRLPTHVFCARGQNQDIECARDTLLYLSATYNFGLKGDGNKTITLLTLGRIFEQSVTELEIRAAEEDNLPSLGGLSKRKRDGVYYTPEWVTQFIVEETIGKRLTDIKKEIGWKDEDYLTENQIENKTTGYHNYIRGLTKYRERLDKIKIIDPACGSGAFLIKALEYLLTERKRTAELYANISQQESLFDVEQNIRFILSQNIYGVDINSGSIEITKLALWLHTAIPNSPLTTLDKNIRCGNSLVGSEIFSWNEELKGKLSPDEIERINSFDWKDEFPEVFKQGGFDCVVGNPPYVKLQNFKRVETHAADFLVKGVNKEGTPFYLSTQTGNFDLYLPFIEKGLSILKPCGRMGYIAPSLWLKNQYGEGLRNIIQKNKNLERWLDFSSFMVFSEATVYTALQFFTSSENTVIKFSSSPDGAINSSDWNSTNHQVEYKDLPDSSHSWNLLPKNEASLLSKLYSNSKELSKVSDAIFQGLVTSADKIYHLEKIGDNKYLNSNGEEKIIEDDIMKPLISGKQATRYGTPDTTTYLLFPYKIKNLNKGERARLLSAHEMKIYYPLAWSYLKSHEQSLRSRERGKMDRDEDWWGYVYPKNLDKHEKTKLIVPRVVKKPICSVDLNGSFYLDNVDVGGVSLSDSHAAFFLSAIFNSNVTQWVFSKISRPLQNGYYSANKQFISPLPIPNCKEDQNNNLISLSKTLSSLHTEYNSLTSRLNKRLGSCTWKRHNEKKIFNQAIDQEKLKKRSPKNLTDKERKEWIKKETQLTITTEKEKLASEIRSVPSVKVDDKLLPEGELSLVSGGTTLLSGVFFNNEKSLYGVWWNKLCRDFTNPRTLVANLLKEPQSEDQELLRQTIDLDFKLQELSNKIKAAEDEVNEEIYKAFSLTPDEIRMIKESISSN